MGKGTFAKFMKKKLALLFVIVMVAFLILISRITAINAGSGEKYKKKVLDQHQYNNRPIPFKRGDILDRNGTKLATSERVYKVILDCKVLLSDEKYLEPTKNSLFTYLEIPNEKIDEIIEKTPNSRYSILQKNVPYDKAVKFKELIEDPEKNENIGGVWLEEDYIRNYPYNDMAADLIGFTVDGNVGSNGIEGKYNDVLNGTDGRDYGYRDEDATFTRTVISPIDGQNVVTTIDLQIQSIIERHIKEFNEAHQGEAREGEGGSKNTAVVVMNPQNGEILGMASYPGYDLNNPRNLETFFTPEQLEAMTSEEKNEFRNNLWNNFCVSSTYEPGSTFKLFPVAAALDRGILNGDETFYCGGSTQIADYSIGCAFGKAHGTQTIKQVIENSCNVSLTNIGLQIGADQFSAMQKAFGFGEYTGIDLPGEALTAGLLYKAENMKAIDLATNSFGQNFNVTMMQMSSAFSSLINGGEYYQPQVVKQVTDDKGVVTKENTPKMLKRTTSQATSDILKDYLRGVVAEGTGSAANIEGYEIGGKTGTAEKLPRGTGNYLVSFIGYAPQDNPQVMVYVVIDEPNVDNQAYGSYPAVMAGSIMNEVLPYLGVSKTEP
ncbi:MAG TPA: peptidoglycan glycosyltransferase [Candidatus Dorea intestinavium]|nr:peptidoglycan glycosyltransferase [Candidatus Dorea intestinavium]